jgi:hypothetical protein
MLTSHRVALVALAAASVAACGRKQDTAAPVATPTVTIARPQVSIGSPLEMKYRFVVAPDAPPFNDDYWVFVHFLDADGELMWTDDHQPATPTRRWKPGETIEYERTMFVPKFPYTGQTVVEIGLFSRQTNQRLPLSGDTKGQRSYTVASFDLQPQNDTQFVVFKDGWHPTEVADDAIGTEWQWSKKEATLTFRNPKRDVTIYLQLDRPVAGYSEPLNVQIRIGEAVVDAFSLAPKQAELRKFPVTAARLGSADTVEMKIVVDRTFVPAQVPELKSTDPRELGVRVFRAYIETR